jgi:putative ABC transport system permease protein
MSLRDLIVTAFSNLGRHKVRTVLTAVGVTVGILTIVTMVSLGIGVQREMISNFKSIGLETLTIRPKTEERTAFNQFGEPHRTKIISPELVEEIQAMDQVVDVIPRIYLPYSMNVVLDVGGKNERVRHISDPTNDSPTEPFELPVKLLAGRQITWDEQGQIVLDEDVLENLEEDCETLIGQQVKLVLHAPRGESQTFSFTVAGVTSGQWGVVIGLADQLAMKEWWYDDSDLLQTQGYDALTVKTRSLNDATQMLDKLEEMGFEVRSLKTVMDMANRGIIILQTMLGSVGGLALLVASIGIANTMVMAVYERTREIGILKAVGAAPHQIRVLFMLEATLIGLLGGVVGTIGGWLLGLGLNRLILLILAWQDIDFPPTKFFTVSWWLVVLALTFAVLVGLLAGLYPAARAARLDPLEALRHE